MHTPRCVSKNYEETTNSNGAREKIQIVKKSHSEARPIGYVDGGAEIGGRAAGCAPLSRAAAPGHHFAWPNKVASPPKNAVLLVKFVKKISNIQS